MKVCLNCGLQFSDESWRCKRCDYEPDQPLGYPQFAPALTELAEGFDASYFGELARYEAGHFWFESRNALIIWAIQKYFHDAKTMMEVGCGTGFVLLGLHTAIPNLDLSGSEIFNTGLKITQERVPNAAVYQMDIEHIPFEKAFDIIGAFDVLEHIRNDEEALRQIASAVKPGGGILITVPQHHWLWSMFDTYAHHQRRYSRAELTRKVEAAGLKVEFATSFMSLLLPLMIPFRKGGSQTEASYDLFAEFRIHPLLNKCLTYILKVERFLIRQGISFPVGGSLLVAAKRPLE